MISVTASAPTGISHYAYISSCNRNKNDPYINTAPLVTRVYRTGIMNKVLLAKYDFYPWIKADPRSEPFRLIHSLVLYFSPAASGLMKTDAPVRAMIAGDLTLDGTTLGKCLLVSDGPG